MSVQLVTGVMKDIIFSGVVFVVINILLLLPVLVLCISFQQDVMFLIPLLSGHSVVPVQGGMLVQVSIMHAQLLTPIIKLASIVEPLIGIGQAHGVHNSTGAVCMVQEENL